VRELRVTVPVGELVRKGAVRGDRWGGGGRGGWLGKKVVKVVEEISGRWVFSPDGNQPHRRDLRPLDRDRAGAGPPAGIGGDEIPVVVPV